MRQRGIVLRTGAVGVGGVTLSLLLAACGSSGGTGSADRLGTPGARVPSATAGTPSSGSGPTVLAPTDGVEGAVGRIVLNAYQGWWDARIQAYARSDSDASQLRALSSGQALSEALASMKELQDAKLVMIGAPRSSAVVRTLDLKSDPNTAVVEDCLDVTDWHQADAASRTVSDPPQRLSRYVVTSKLRRTATHWLVVEYQREVSRTC